ncbi:hypothetical protein [Pseudonocardia sp.]|uniref:hypothetical protein n=1 Tax=Pseudonocardia sp. TaxID=60912 RepID=UPI003D0E2A3F
MGRGTVRRAGWSHRLSVIVLAATLAVLLAVPAAGSPAGGALVAQALRTPGTGSYVFTGYPPLADRPVRVWYSAPRDPATAQIVVAVHGLSRDGRAHRDDWARLVAGRNVLVLVPELTRAAYPDYNTGHVVDDRGVRQPPDRWTFPLVEALFDHAVAATGSRERDYALFGFSGGAQFVHRFVELMPVHRARVAVAANAGWYTMPDDTVPYPYGLAGAPVRSAGLGRAFATELVLLLGQRDTDPRDPSLLHDPRADRQGMQRLERGRAFFAAAARTARAHGFPLHWRVWEVPGLGHVHATAAQAALPYLLV